MSPVRFAIEKPVTVIVGVLMVTLFGVLAALALPVQLTPNVDRPLVTVQTRWEGASPLEIEREIIDEQEDQLKSVESMRRMTSTAVEGTGTVELEFAVGVDINRALLDVSDKLRQVKEYPENVDEPVISAGETEGASAIGWFILRALDATSGRSAEIPRLRTLIEEVVKPRLERAEGVAAVGVVGGVEKEVHVRVDPRRLAARHLTLLDVRDALRRHNVDVSAGSVDQGKRSYVIRTVGKFESIAPIEELVLARPDGGPIYLRDVAEVRFGYKKPESVVRSLGRPAIAVNATRQSGTNVLAVMSALQDAVAETNQRILRPLGLELTQVYDQTVYIDSAVALVSQNLWVGGALTILILLLFLRSGRSTIIVAVAIPISVIGSFLALNVLGRNLNVISLAGLAFAVGMVVDNSIVVLENIYRHRQEGKSARDAAFIGTQEVWGAVLASTLTTLAVFLPVVFVEEEAGQLFRDIAIAISAAVFLSLLVSVLFIPMASSRLLVKVRPRGANAPAGSASGRRGATGRFVAFGQRFRAGVTGVVGWILRSTFRRVATVGGSTGAALVLSWVFLPPMSYLPQGNQNLVIGFMIPPPGYNPDEFERIGRQIEERMAPYWSGELSAALRRPDWYEGDGEVPGISNFFYVARGQSVFMGARSTDDENVAPVKDLLAYAARDIPGTMVFSTQRSLFERGLDSGNTIELQVSGTRMADIQQTALALMGRVFTELGPARPEPSNFNLGAPEVQLEIDGARAAEVGLNVADVGFIVQSMVGGAVVTDYRDEGVTIDVKIVPSNRGELVVEELTDIPLFTPAGELVALGAVARFVETTGPTEIRHIELDRAVTLNVIPPEGMELSTAMDVLDSKVLAPLHESGAIPDTVAVSLTGTADKLQSTRDSLKWNFLLALVITYLLLAALFEHFGYPLVILFSVPLAAVGGIIGLRIVHHYTGHQMDVLTMLGFVILIGTVVNNAILIVHQGLQSIREGKEPRAAIEEAVRLRVRPIFMSTSTSICGMLPLVLFPGAGSELYRGLGSVVVGGLAVSTVFTLVVVPALFGQFVRPRKPGGDGSGDAEQVQRERGTSRRPPREAKPAGV